MSACAGESESESDGYRAFGPAARPEQKVLFARQVQDSSRTARAGGGRDRAWWPAENAFNPLGQNDCLYQRIDGSRLCVLQI